MLFVEKIIVLIFSVIIVTMFSQVVFRYLLNQSLYWSEEIVRYLFVWMVFIGGALVTREDGHIGIDYLFSVIPVHVTGILKLAASLVVVAVSIFFLITGIELMLRLQGSQSPALGLPINWFLYAALPASSIASAWYGIQNFITLSKTVFNRSQEVDLS